MQSLKIETVGPWNQAAAAGVGVQQRRLILLREGKPIDSWRIAITPSEADLALLDGIDVGVCRPALAHRGRPPSFRVLRCAAWPLPVAAAR
jgi:hypothetical protein